MSRDFEGMTDAEHEATFDVIHDVADRYGLSFDDAEVFVENSGYYGEGEDQSVIKQPRNQEAK